MQAKVKESGLSTRFSKEYLELENISWEHLSLIDKASLVKLEEMVLLLLGKQLNLTNLPSGTNENAAAMRVRFPHLLANLQTCICGRSFRSKPPTRSVQFENLGTGL